MMGNTIQGNSDEMDSPNQPLEKIERLCNEIQLFDLCEKTRCSSKVGRFCTDPDLLLRFEKIEEQESRRPVPELSDEWDEEIADEFDDEPDNNDEFFDDEFYDDEE